MITIAESAVITKRPLAIKEKEEMKLFGLFFTNRKIENTEREKANMRTNSIVVWRKHTKIFGRVHVLNTTTNRVPNKHIQTPEQLPQKL